MTLLRSAIACYKMHRTVSGGLVLDRRISTEPAFQKIRQGLALPVYVIGLLLDDLSAALGRLGAWIAGDDWPG